MAWTTPASWTTSEVVTAAKMNTHVRDNLTYLKDVITGVQNQPIIYAYAAADASGPSIKVRKGRGTLGSPAIVQSGDTLAFWEFEGHDGAAYQQAAYIVAIVDGTPGAGDMPGRLGFFTTPDGVASASERFRAVTAGLQVIAGTSVLPSISSISDPNTGFRWTGSDVIGVVSNGTELLQFGNSGQLWAGDGNASFPGLAFMADQDNGLYRAATNQLAGATAGVQRFLIPASNQFQIAGQGDGGAQYSWIGDTNTGWGSAAADTISGIVGGASLLGLAYNAAVPYVLVDGSLQIGVVTSFGGGVGVVGIRNATTVPTSNPTSGGVMWVEAGALKYRGSGGTVTTLGPA